MSLVRKFHGVFPVWLRPSKDRDLILGNIDFSQHILSESEYPGYERTTESLL